MSPELSNMVLFLGRFHPLLVHLPIGSLILLAVLEMLACLTRWKGAAQSRPWILGFACASCTLSAILGWMLAREGGYDLQLLRWHQVAGFSVAGAAFLTLLMLRLDWRRAYRICLGIAVLMISVASHLGGSMTHGRDFLTHFAPDSIRKLFGQASTASVAVKEAEPPMRRPVFAGIIEPILRERCVACHGPVKHKADLRLDTLEGLLRGGQDGPVIKPGEAKDSSLVQCILTPVDADGHMPPENQPQLTAGEIAMLEWWIDRGAPASTKVFDLQPKPEIQRLVGIVSEHPAQ